ncbi:MAG: septum formation protein Maf [Alphaproteobacteria bacterium]|nr:MAG: septum formation protein Maf [Alphaproteobacteria bacterium]
MGSSEISIILASQSPARARLLAAAGVLFTTQRAAVDENTVRLAMTDSGARPREIAETLAEMKALRVSSSAPDALVIGSDQILVLDDVVFSKAEDLDGARTQLRTLRGKTHQLVTAVCVARGGGAIWRHIETVRITMRDFSDRFLDHYLANVGETVLSSVGCYHLEGLGVQLMRQIEGDHFTVQGLPLLALLQYLRDYGALES